MARIMILMMAIVFALGFLAPITFAEEHPAMGMGKPSAVSSLIGTSVHDPKGEYLGRISNFLIDPQGQVTFAIVSHGGFLRFGEKDVAVPYGAFSYDRNKRYFFMDVTRDKLNAAPAFTSRDLYSEKWAEDMYRYFGKAPYWTEGELVEQGIKPMEESLEDFGGAYIPDAP